MALEYKDQELRQQGDRLANLELQMKAMAEQNKAMAEAIRQGQHHGRQGLQLQEQRQGQDRGSKINVPATGRQGQRQGLQQLNGSAATAGNPGGVREMLLSLVKKLTADQRRVLSGKLRAVLADSSIDQDRKAEVSSILIKRLRAEARSASEETSVSSPLGELGRSCLSGLID